MTRQLFTAFTLAAMMSGCSQINSLSESTDFEQGTMVSDEQTALFTPSVSTFDDVTKSIGFPDKTSRVGRRTLLTYHYIKTPYIPFTGRKQTEQIVVFEFDKHDVLTKIRKRVIQDNEPAI